MRILGVIVLMLAAATAWGWYHFQPQTLELSPRALTPAWEIRDGVPSVSQNRLTFIATVATFDDELYGYFNFDYLRSRSIMQGADVLLTHKANPNMPASFPVVLHLDNNLLTALPVLENLRTSGYIPGYEWRYVAPQELRQLQQQSAVFVAAYNLPVQRTLEGFTPEQIHEYVRRFVVFKSRTDPRVRKGIQPVPPTLTREEAERLATDVITVADFFWLPLDFFLGIGAMENNYMDVDGDLKHAVWKPRAQPDDIVLRRRGDRVLVLNKAAGVWQITRETLRYAHELYRKGHWDYTLLPEHLRPPAELDLNEIEAAHLTTYAGLLFRDLIDRFQGDVASAVGAYNGGPGNPNMKYERGVRMVANYARRMLEQAARLNGAAVAETSFLAPSRP